MMIVNTITRSERPSSLYTLVSLTAGHVTYKKFWLIVASVHHNICFFKLRQTLQYEYKVVCDIQRCNSLSSFLKGRQVQYDYIDFSAKIIVEIFFKNSTGQY